MSELIRVPLELEVATGGDTRILIRTHTTPAGHDRVAVLPQRRGRDGAWRLQHSGLVLSPDQARETAPALLQVADAVGGDR